MKNKQGGNGTLFTDADNAWGDGALANRQTVAVDAQYGTAMTWDYYKNVHGRERHRQRRPRRVQPRALRAQLQQRVLAGLVLLHDLRRRRRPHVQSVRLARRGRPRDVPRRHQPHRRPRSTRASRAGSTRATSDIFGTMVEFFANNANDTPDYLIGERALQVGHQRAALHVPPEPRRRVGRLLVRRPRQPQRPLLVGRRQPLLLSAGRGDALRPAVPPARRASRTIRGRRPATGVVERHRPRGGREDSGTAR